MRTYRTRSSLLFSTVVYLVMIFTLAACLIPFIYMLALSIS
ncbi:MAG: carbohydrate ABC transporter permease, partial [Spirochaetales bacterium]|nr:carbohydrate ABC transporter permease [Spirochaetales bacterium]